MFHITFMSYGPQSLTSTLYIIHTIYIYTLHTTVSILSMQSILSILSRLPILSILLATFNLYTTYLLSVSHI